VPVDLTVGAAIGHRVPVQPSGCGACASGANTFMVLRAQ